MNRSLIIAEKPSVARDIAKVLGINKSRKGYIENDKYVITWAVGHLVELCDPVQYSPSLKKWDKNRLPFLTDFDLYKNIILRPNPKTIDQYQVIVNLINSNSVDSLIEATDAGREGELIFRYIYDLTKCSKPFKRLWISSMTSEAILEGFNNLKEGKEFDSLYYAAKCRSIADWLVGLNATRAFTVSQPGKELYTIGRVQTPTLNLIVEREREIKNFIPQKYFDIYADFSLYTGKYTDKSEDSDSKKLTDPKKVQEIIDNTTGKEGIIISASKKDKKELPPLLYDLTELQRECNRRFGFSADKTLSVAQSLYESRKAVTYPRTDSRYLSSDFKDKIKPLLKALSETYLKDLAGKLLNGKLETGKRIFDDSKITDHHAIIPVSPVPQLKQFSIDEKKVYDLIARRFLSVFYPPAVYAQVRIETKVEDYLFVTTGRALKIAGWKELEGKSTADNEKDGEDKNNSLPPDLKKGQKVTVSKVESKEKETTPPKHYTEATLLSAMESAGKFVEDEELREQLKDGGIGTPATRASVIEKLISTQYIVRQNKNLLVTEKAEHLIDNIPDVVKSPSLTGEWEKHLNNIARKKGAMTPEEFMNGISKVTEELVAGIFNPSLLKESLGTCPLCKKGKVISGKKGYGCTRWKENCPFRLFPEDPVLVMNKIKLTDELISALCINGYFSVSSDNNKSITIKLKITGNDFYLEKENHGDGSRVPLLTN